MTSGGESSSADEQSKLLIITTQAAKVCLNGWLDALKTSYPSGWRLGLSSEVSDTERDLV